jgi:hypothetical protein
MAFILQGSFGGTKVKKNDQILVQTKTKETKRQRLPSHKTTSAKAFELINLINNQRCPCLSSKEDQS